MELQQIVILLLQVVLPARRAFTSTENLSFGSASAQAPSSLRWETSLEACLFLLLVVLLQLQSLDDVFGLLQQLGVEGGAAGQFV